MTEYVWDKFLTERDKAVFAAGGVPRPAAEAGAEGPFAAGLPAFLAGFAALLSLTSLGAE